MHAGLAPSWRTHAPALLHPTLQAPIKAVSPTGGGTAAAGGPSHGAAPSKGSKDEHKIVKCQADGCKADLSILKNWRRERHIW